MSISASALPAAGSTVPPLLRRTLLANAAVSDVLGIVLVLFGGPVAAWMAGPDATLLGIDLAWVLRALGVGLLVFALGVFLTSRGLPRRAWAVRLITVLDIGWVAGSILTIALAASALSGMAVAVIAVLAVDVALFAVLQSRGLRQMGA